MTDGTVQAYVKMLKVMLVNVDDDDSVSLNIVYKYFLAINPSTAGEFVNQSEDKKKPGVRRLMPRSANSRWL